jgi:hypothetical protein
MSTYTCTGFRPVEADSHREAAEIFAARIARKAYGRCGHCRAIRLDCRTEDGRSYTFEAFVGRPVRGENATAGANVWIHTRRVGGEA